MGYIGNAERLTDMLKQTTEQLDSNAAVVVLLKSTNQGFQVLFVKRAEKSGDPWSGQTALPGGKRNPEDRNLKETVVRETLEETCINLFEGCRFLGIMEPVRLTQKPEMKILSFIVLLEKEQTIKLNEELTEYFWMPLKELAKHKGTVKFSFGEYPHLNHRKPHHLGTNLQNHTQSSFAILIHCIRKAKRRLNFLFLTFYSLFV